MLKRMRKHVRSGFIKVLLGMIILAFVFWGISAVVQGGRVDVVATIDGDSIAASHYQRELKQLRQLYRNLYRDSYSADLERAMNVEGQALDNLIENYLLVREAKRLGLAVSDEEVARSVMATFQTGGRYSPQQYRAVLRSQNMTPPQFENAERRRLLIAKLENLIADGVPVGEEEIEESFIAENERLTVSFIKLSFSSFRENVKVGEEEIAAYYESSKEDFREPARVRIAYATYTPEQFEKDVVVSSEEIEATYDRLRNNFVEPERVHIRHILVAVPPGASDEAKEELRKKAETARKSLVEGGDFAEAARSNSDDEATAAEGGDLGLVEITQLEASLISAVAELAEGEIGPVVETPQGFEILKLEERQPERVKPLEEVKAKLIAKLKREGAGEAALEARLQDLTRVRGGETLEKVLAKRGLTVERSQPVAPGEPIAGVTQADKLIRRAFELDAGQVEQVNSLSPPYYLLQLTDKIPSLVPQLDAVRAKITDKLAERKAKAAAIELAEEMLAKLRNKSATLEEVARASALEVKESEPFTVRDSLVSGLGAGFNIVQELFRLTPEAPIVAEPVVLGNAAAVVVLKEKSRPDLSGLDDEAKADIRRRLLDRRRREAVIAFRRLLKSQSDIRINPNRIAGRAGTG